MQIGFAVFRQIFGEELARVRPSVPPPSLSPEEFESRRAEANVRGGFFTHAHIESRN